ncbi:conserved Plasmodium protein, unknown function [Plasmodium relictum]|uniref:3'-5' exonuclease domain-containing protein n=1 Tax=Plasmodium relictum TaxID=85471 RepID=A0A1J1HCC7_PLARL|nr:conserved Plasmodium protein, unknown function [Plasmodium relictum]CRH03137.1 conserved Plasmodium protein, unknown function [Plasmodium relictum]
MKESSLENELEVFYEYIISIEHLLINFSNYIKRKKTVKKIIEKNELLNSFVLKYINKNVPTKLSLHMKCTKNKKFYEYLFLCSFYHVIINYIIFDPLFNLQKNEECGNEENKIMNNTKNENDEYFVEKYLSFNKKIGVEKESNVKRETNKINMQNNNEFELSDNTHTFFDTLKRKKKEGFSANILDITVKESIKFQKLNDEYFILSSTYEQICDIIFSFGILCYIYGFYKFFKIENIKIRKNKKFTYNLFSWVYSIKYNVLESVKLNSISKRSNFKENENDKNYLSEKFFQEFTSRELKNFKKDVKEEQYINMNRKHFSSKNIKNNNVSNLNKENGYYNMNSSNKNDISSNNSNKNNNLNNINYLNYTNHYINSCDINYLNEILLNNNFNNRNIYRSKNKINNSNENMEHYNCSSNLNFSSKEEKKLFFDDEKDEKDKIKKKNIHMKNDEYYNYYLKYIYLNNYNINKNDTLVKSGNVNTDYEFYSYMILKKIEIEKIFLLYKEQKKSKLSLENYITIYDNIINIENKENSRRNGKEICDINYSEEYKENTNVTINEINFNNANVKYADDIQPSNINSYNNFNGKKKDKKKYEFIKIHLDNLYQKMKNIKTSKVYIWIYLYVNYAFDFLFNNSRKNYRKINNFNLCFDESQYEYNNDNINCNTSNNYYNNISKNNENNIRKKRILFNLSGFIEFIKKKSNFEKKHIKTNLKNYIDNELFNFIKKSDTEDNVLDEKKSKNDIEFDEYHIISLYQNNEIEKINYENVNNDDSNKYIKEGLIIDNDLNYNEIRIDSSIHNKNINKIDSVDNFFVKKNEYDFVNININLFVNNYIYMFVSYVCLNAIKLSILLIEKYNLTIPNKYMDISCYIYICQKNKLNSNILFFINKYNIHHYVFSNDIANKDIKENYYIYKNIEFHNTNNKHNDVTFLFMGDIISINHIKKKRYNKSYNNAYSNNYKIKNNINMTHQYLRDDNNKIPNEIKYNNNYKFYNHNLNNLNNFYVNNNNYKMDNWYNSRKNKNDDYSFSKKEYFDDINNNCLPNLTISNNFRNCSYNNEYSKYKHMDNNFIHFESIKGKDMNIINSIKSYNKERKQNIVFSNFSEEIKRNKEYNNFITGNYFEKNMNNVRYLYENGDNTHYEGKNPDNIINKNHINVYNKMGTPYSVNNIDKNEEKYYNNKYKKMGKEKKDYMHGFYYKNNDEIELSDISNVMNSNNITEKNNKEIIFDTNNIKNVNFLNNHIYPLKLNVVYDLYLNDILINEAKISNIIDNCKGDKTLELELIKQKIMSGNIKYAIKLIRIFNYELLLFPNLFFYLNFKSYNYILNTFDKKYLIYYLYDNPKYLKIYFSSLIKKKNFEYCLIALYFLYPYISSEDSDFQTFCHLFLRNKKFKKMNYNTCNKGFQTPNENEYIETNKNDSLISDNYNNLCSFIKRECFILNDIYFIFKNEIEFDGLRRLYKLSDLCKYFDIFKNLKKINLDIIRNSFHYLTEINGTCSCQKKYICIKDLGSSLKDVVIIETYDDFILLYENIRKTEKVIFIDAEWKCAIFRENPIISIFQIALKNNCLSYIVDVKKISIENYEINYYISELFRDESIIKIGVAFLNNDMLYFRKYYDILTMLIYEKYENILIEENTIENDENNYNNLIKYRMEMNNTNNYDIFLKKIMRNIYEYANGNCFNDNKNCHFSKNNFHPNDKKKEHQIDKKFNLNEDISFKNIFPVNYFLKNKKNVALIKKLLTTKCSSCNKIGIYSCIHKYYNLEFICNKYYDDLNKHFPFLKKNMNYSVKIIGKSLFPEKEVNKECQLINWNFRPLSSISVEYAILDVLILKNFFNLIQTKLSFNIENAL